MEWLKNCSTTSDVELKIIDMLHGGIIQRQRLTDGVLVKIEATGCKKEDIKIIGRPDGSMTVFLPETDFYYPEMTKEFKVDKSLDALKSSAKYKHGVLEIHIPFKEDAIGKEIEIEDG